MIITGWSLNFAEDADSCYWTRSRDICHEDSEELHIYKEQELCRDCFMNVIKEEEWRNTPITEADTCDRCNETPVTTKVIRGKSICHGCAKDMWHNDWCELFRVYNTYSKTNPYLDKGDS